MGFSKKSQTDGGLESENKKWVIAGIAIRASLKPIKTTKAKGGRESEGDYEDEEEAGLSTTPTAKEARIPERLPCPPAPRKRRPSRCNFNNGATREFFTPPDLETVLKLHVEKAN
ncbi:cyclin-dependent protein kinase inhibitor SMR6 [Citrus sinensis]|uniref:Cyclin-dependent protein kinase inhibitor SMR6 n=1 Tax=Citrus sinensis TaxID=2711 RepID=A0ACB8MYI9_CITSI|nr:cyclin-dependent protein kinase inhibitor SMR6 [Citrus sinensis]